MPTPATKGKLEATNPITMGAEQYTKQERAKVIDEGAEAHERRLARCYGSQILDDVGCSM